MMAKKKANRGRERVSEHGKRGPEKTAIERGGGTATSKPVGERSPIAIEIAVGEGSPQEKQDSAAEYSRKEKPLKGAGRDESRL